MAVRIECQSMSFRYNKKPVLEKISFSARAGTFSAILGRNGSGKTTLLHTLNGINRPFKGEVLINNRSAAAMSQKKIARQVSLVPQEHNEIFPFKVLDVVVMGRAPFLKMTSSPGPEDYRLAMEALKTLKAERMAENNFNAISGGERQIALLAAALVQSSQTMLLDEPTNHLDFNNQYLLLSTIKNLCQAKGLCVIASMHDPNMAMLFADQVIMMEKGKILFQGSACDTMTKKNIDRLFQLDSAAIELPDNKRLFLPAHVFE